MVEYGTCGYNWLVEKCVACHATMHKSEKVCTMCGSEVPADPNKVTIQQRFLTVLKVGFIFSAVLTVASIFTNYTPSFMKCMMTTLVFGLATNSMHQMRENR